MSERKPRKPRNARSNPPSTWPAKAVEWPVATNAGPFLPEMFPFGVGGFRQTYALNNPDDDDAPQNLSAFKSKYGPFKQVMYIRLINESLTRIYLLMGELESQGRTVYTLSLWDDVHSTVWLNGGMYGQILMTYSKEEALTVSRDIKAGVARGKLVWLPPNYLLFYTLPGRGVAIQSARFKTRVYTIVRMPAGRFKVVVAFEDQKRPEGVEVITVVRDRETLAEAMAYAELHAGL